MITVRCTWCQDWELPSRSGVGLLEALRRHEQNCPAKQQGINFLKEKTR